MLRAFEILSRTIIASLFRKFPIARYVAIVYIDKLCASKDDVFVILLFCDEAARVIDVSDVHFVFFSNLACEFIHSTFVCVLSEFANKSTFSMLKNLL